MTLHYALIWLGVILDIFWALIWKIIVVLAESQYLGHFKGGHEGEGGWDTNSIYSGQNWVIMTS